MDKTGLMLGALLGLLCWVVLDHWEFRSRTSPNAQVRRDSRFAIREWREIVRSYRAPRAVVLSVHEAADLLGEANQHGTV